MKKTALFVAIVLCLSLVLASCGEAKPEPNSSDSETETTSVQNHESTSEKRQNTESVSKQESKISPSDPCQIDLRALDFQEIPMNETYCNYVMIDMFLFFGRFENVNDCYAFQGLNYYARDLEEQGINIEKEYEEAIKKNGVYTISREDFMRPFRKHFFVTVDHFSTENTDGSETESWLHYNKEAQQYEIKELHTGVGGHFGSVAKKVMKVSGPFAILQVYSENGGYLEVCMYHYDQPDYKFVYCRWLD